MRDESDTLTTLKLFLAYGIPFLIGFLVPTTLTRDGLISNSHRARTIRGGQAAIAIGYDDAIRIGSHKGALQIRTSWGSQWGDQGNGWLPYELLELQGTAEFWTTICLEWATTMLDW